MQQTPKTAAEYQAEMMQLYRRAHPETEVPTAPATEPPAPEIRTVPETSMPPVAPEVPPEPVPEPIPEPQPMPEMPESQTEPLPESMAEQQLPEEPQPLPESEEPLITGTGEVLDFPQLETEEVPPPQTLPLEPIPPLTSKTSYGFLKVITRTASEAMPMPNVTVTVSAIVDGESRLFYTTTTNESGETERIPLPAPVQKSEQQPNEIPLFQSYDVSIHYPGYFRMESRSVPIFVGITSLQKFAMIPLPQFSDATTQTIIYENTEPKR
mgnify:FL=1